MRRDELISHVLAGVEVSRSPLEWRRDGPTWVGWLTTSDGLTIRLQVVPLDDSYRRYPVE